MKKLKIDKLTQKNFFWNMLGVLTVSFTSLFYAIILTRYSNLEQLGIFSFAFSFACMMVTLASYGGRTYQITDSKNETSEISYILTRYLTVSFTFLLVILFIISKDYNIEKVIIIILTCVFKFTEELSDVYYGIIQKNNKLYYVGRYQFLKSILNIFIFLLLTILLENLIITLLGIVSINLIFTFLVERRRAKKIKEWDFKINKKEIVKILKTNSLICIYAFLAAYIISAPKYAIDNYLTSEIQGIFNIIIMPASVMFLISSFIINPIIVDIANKYNENKFSEIVSTVKKIVVAVFLIGIVALIVTYFLGIPVLNIVYDINLNDYKIELLIIIVGAILYTITAIISTILIACRKIKSQFYLSIVNAIFAFVISEVLVAHFSIMGGAISYFATMIFRFVLYILLLVIIFKKTKQIEKTDYSNIKVLHLLFSNSFSGAENVACTIIENYNGNKYDMYYCCPKGTIETALKDRNIKYLPLNKWSIFEIRRIIKENNIDIIHAHDFTASIMAILTLFDGKIISHIHCNPDFIKKWNVFSIIYNWGIDKFNKVILVSKETLDDTVFETKLRSKMVVINNVVNPEQIIKKSEEYNTKKYDIVFLGRIIDIKNPQVVIEVTRMLKKEFPNIKTCLVGDGLLMDNCKELVEKYGLNNNVTFVGFKNNPFPYIKNSKIALMPSKNEGLGMSAIECLILNVPVLNSGKGGLATIFQDDKEYICNENDEYYAKAKQILLKKDSFCSENHQQIASKYTDINGYIKEILGTYK